MTSHLHMLGHFCCKRLYAFILTPSDDKTLSFCWSFASISLSGPIFPPVLMFHCSWCLGELLLLHFTCLPSALPARCEHGPACCWRLDGWLLASCRSAAGSLALSPVAVRLQIAGFFSQATYHLHTIAAWGVWGWWTTSVALSLKYRIFYVSLHY